jgi:hypothetical protein
LFNRTQVIANIAKLKINYTVFINKYGFLFWLIHLYISLYHSAVSLFYINDSTTSSTASGSL